MKKLASLAMMVAALMFISSPFEPAIERTVASATVAPATSTPVATPPISTGGIFSVAACKDIATVAVSGISGWATNRIKVAIYRQDSNGNWKWFHSAKSDNFGSGYFNLPIVVDYKGNSIAEGTLLQIDVEVQHLNGGSFVDFATDTTTLTVTDKNCADTCSVTLTTNDRAPVDGTITLRTHFGAWFRPEGRLYGVMPVNAGQPMHFTIVGMPCGAAVRAWYYPASGKDRMPKLLLSQYWPGEFAATTADGSIPYATSFASGLPATKPLESDDPYAPK